MKTIYLLRHAKAEVFDENKPDKERKLVTSGIEDAKAIAKSLKANAITPDLIMSSDTSRTIATAKIFAKKLKIEVSEIAVNQEILTAVNAKSLLNVIKGLDEKYGSVMIVGHNPSISSLAGLLIKPFTFNLPKAGLLAIECSGSTWSDITTKKNQVKFFTAPLKKKKVDKLRSELRKNLGNKIETNILETMTGAFVGMPPKIANLIRKKSRQIAVEYINAQEYLLLKTMDQIILFFDLLGIEKEVEKDSADNMKKTDVN